MKTVAATHYTN